MQDQQFALHADIEERHWWFLARREILRAVIEQVVPPRTGGVVVDIGCGTGANIAALADDYKCYGIDTSAQGIDLARARFPRVEFICGQAPDDFRPEQMQAPLFLLNDVLEHIGDDFLFFSRLWQALPVGAHLLLTVPADEGLWTQHDVSFGHYRRYDIPRLSMVWQGFPATVRLSSPFMSRLYPIAKMVRRYNQWRGQTGGRAGTNFSMPPRPMNWLLRRIMAGEARALVRTLDSPRQAYRRGVSLLVLLRREPGDVEVRSRPPHVAPDLHDPIKNATHETPHGHTNSSAAH